MLIFRRKRRNNKTESPNSNKLELNNKVNQSPNLTLQKLSQCIIPSEDITIEFKLGEGNFGEVYKADWNGTPVAVKKLKGEEISQFESEASKLSQLNHPNVNKFFFIFIFKKKFKKKLILKRLLDF